MPTVRGKGLPRRRRWTIESRIERLEDTTHERDYYIYQLRFGRDGFQRVPTPSRSPVTKLFAET